MIFDNYESRRKHYPQPGVRERLLRAESLEEVRYLLLLVHERASADTRRRCYRAAEAKVRELTGVRA